MRKVYLLMFLLLGVYTFAQKISGTIIDNKTKKPLENAFVFIENSSINTLSNKDGYFLLDLKGMTNNIIIDYLGYDAYLIPKEKLKQEKFNISLNSSEENLEELVIKKSPFSRKEMMQAFKKYFLGTTSNGKNCKIINEKDIILYFDMQTNTLYAESAEPIRVVNKNLDYKIKFYLQNFQANFNTRSLNPFNYRGSSFVGFSSYEDVSSNVIKSEKKRKETYEKGIASFFKALATDRLSEKKEYFYLNGFIIDDKEYFQTIKNDEGFVIQNIKKPTKKVPRLPEKGEIITIENGVASQTIEVPVNLNIYNSKTKNKSIMQLNAEQIDIDLYGNLKYPDQVYFGGYFGDLKLGDMLPLDFAFSK